MTEEEFLEEQEKYAHALQTGVKMEHELGSQDGTPKHLRVGVNLSLVGEASLGKLLIDKGIITLEEYMQYKIDFLKMEVERYEVRLSKALNANVHLM